MHIIYDLHYKLSTYLLQVIYIYVCIYNNIIILHIYIYIYIYICIYNNIIILHNIYIYIYIYIYTYIYDMHYMLSTYLLQVSVGLLDQGFRIIGDIINTVVEIAFDLC